MNKYNGLTEGAVRTPTEQQSYLRFPLNRVLSSEGAVRVLRELLRSRRELSISELADSTRLNAQTVRNLVLGDLVACGVVQSVGNGRVRLFRADLAHPLMPSLAQLFAEEESRVGRIFQAVRAAAQ